MIPKTIGIFLPVFIFSTIFVNLAGATSGEPQVLALSMGEPQVLAQSETPKAISLGKIIDSLIGQATDFRTNLEGLKGLSKKQEVLRQEYLKFLDETLDYYQSLEVNPDGSNVKILATELKDKREGELGAEIKQISDFLLIFQVKAVLKTAENRFSRIRTDLERLIDLKILNQDKAGFLLNDAHLLLVSADELIGQAESNFGTADADTRGLLSEAIGEIKLAYKKFLEISNLLKEALK